MLIEEGMNVKVVLLPDGEDPDSFARRGASAFDTYIKENETDFIRFKMRLLLQESADDPIKRSNVINDILRTIAIIPNNIARAVYLRECSETMGIDEQVLLKEVNRLRLQQEQRGASNYATRISPTTPLQETPPPPPLPAEAAPPVSPPNDTASPSEPPSFELIPLEEEVAQQTPQTPQEDPKVQAPSPYEAYEQSLVRYIVRYGERIIFDYQDEQTQEQIQMRLAEYVRFDLDRDGIQIVHPLYKQILEEAAAHCTEEGFTAYRYFLAHPDAQISLLAANLASEKYQLSKYHSKYQTIEPESERLDFVVPQELYALKEAHIQESIKQLQQCIKEAQTDEETLTLMRQLNELNNLRRLLCKQLGERIILRM